uniref:Uncharacterized protein n=1 Tax=Zea mays TaxID=4577 RepID=A0A804N5H4_MAIZE
MGCLFFPDEESEGARRDPFPTSAAPRLVARTLATKPEAREQPWRGASRSSPSSYSASPPPPPRPTRPSSSRTRKFRSPAPSRASSASLSPSTSTTRDPRLPMMCPLMTTLGQQKCLSLSLERNRRHWKGLTLVPLLHTHMSWRPKHRAGSRVHQLSLHTVFPQRQLFRSPPPHFISTVKCLQVVQLIAISRPSWFGPITINRPSRSARTTSKSSDLKTLLLYII